MKLLVLLVVSCAGLVAGITQLELADRIVSTEAECERLYKLNENWNIDNYSDQAVIYVDLYFLCEDSLAEDKFAYIDSFHVDMTLYPGDKFPVLSSSGAQLVSKPPSRTQEDIATMQKKLMNFLYKLGGQNNPLYKLTNTQSALSQEIVDQQVSCELLGLLLLKHPKDENTDSQHTACMDKLNCLKEKFMVQHSFTLDRYPDFFPILYKNRGTMLNSPPSSDGRSLCIYPVKPEVYKNELKKWTVPSGVKDMESFVQKRLEELQVTGSHVVDRLKKLGTTSGSPVLTKEQLDRLMKDVEAAASAEDDDDSEPKSKVNIFEKYAEPVFDKISDMEGQGADKINQQRLAMLKEIKEKFDSVDHSAAEMAARFKDVENNKMRPIIQKALDSIDNAEFKVKSKTKAAVNGVKGTVVTAENAGKQAITTVKQDGSALINKLKPKPASTIQFTSSEEEKPHESWLSDISKGLKNSDYLPHNFGLPHVPLPAVLGGNKEASKLEPLTDSNILEMLNSMKKDIKERAKSMNMHGAEIKQAAEVLKRVVNGVLNAAKTNRGPAQGMEPDEVDHAKALVNGLVDFATKGLADDEEDDDEEDLKSLMKDAPVLFQPPPPQPTTAKPAVAEQVEESSESSSDVSETPVVTNNKATQTEAVVPAKPAGTSVNENPQ